MNWKIGKIAEEKRKKGCRVWIGYGKLRIHGKCWRGGGG